MRNYYLLPSSKTRKNSSFLPLFFSLVLCAALICLLPSVPVNPTLAPRGWKQWHRLCNRIGSEELCISYETETHLHIPQRNSSMWQRWLTCVRSRWLITLSDLNIHVCHTEPPRVMWTKDSLLLINIICLSFLLSFFLCLERTQRIIYLLNERKKSS